MTKQALLHFIVKKEDRTIIVERSFNAPLDPVWAAWTRADILCKWWAPKPYECVIKSLDFREGGRWLYYMQGPQGDRHWCFFDYETIEPKSYFSGNDAFCDEHGKANDIKPRVRWEARFEPENGAPPWCERPFTSPPLKTWSRSSRWASRRATRWDSSNSRSCWPRIPNDHTSILPSMTTSTLNMKPTTALKPYVVSREFDAPRALVWKVNTQAEHLEKWLGPEGVTGFTKSMDFRVGGKYHYAQRSADGSFNAWGIMTYLEIDPIDRIVSIQSFSDEHGGIGTHPMAPTWPKVMHWVMDFEDLGNDRTKLSVTWLPVEGSSAEELAMFDSAREGMDGGWKGTFDKLAAYLNSVK